VDDDNNNKVIQYTYYTLNTKW